MVILQMSKHDGGMDDLYKVAEKPKSVLMVWASSQVLGSL
jgi:hypothetical protein